MVSRDVARSICQALGSGNGKPKQLFAGHSAGAAGAAAAITATASAAVGGLEQLEEAKQLEASNQLLRDQLKASAKAGRRRLSQIIPNILPATSSH
jgi:hypothetical protein